MNESDLLDPQKCRELLDQAFLGVCHRRASLRRLVVPLPDDSKAVAQRKLSVLVNEALPAWAEDPLKFIQDLAWVPDPLAKFALIPPGLSPKGRIPLDPFVAQEDFIAIWWECLNSRDSMDIFVEKSRQLAFTSMMMWLALHAWLFRTGTTGVLSTYDDDQIDKGGKGQRDADSLFGRLRTFLDDFLWNFGPCFGFDSSILKFNQHKAPGPRESKVKKRQWVANFTGLDESQDITCKLVRPKWLVGANLMPIFPGAEGNWIVGQKPSDGFGRSITATYAFPDELAHYRKFIKGLATPDDDAYSATVDNVKLRVGVGTPPKGGGSDTLLYRKIHVEPPNDYKRTFRMHWTQNPVFRIGMWWRCRECGHANPYPITRPDPKWPTQRDTCSGCRQKVDVRSRGIHAPSGGDYSSPRYEMLCSKSDKAGIAAELEIDWQGSQLERFFYTWDASGGVAPFRGHDRMVTIEGLDPGKSLDNPAAWLCTRFDPRTATPFAVGYLIVAGQMAEWFVPFFKRWKPSRLLSNENPMMVPWGPHAGKLWRDAYRYEDVHLEMMARVSAVPMARDRLYGDKYGSHQSMTSSPYDDLARYGITVNYQYTKDREELCRKGIDWAARFRIDSSIEGVRFPTGTGREFPSICEVFQNALPKPHTGQGQYKLDVNKQEPPHCSDLVDAWLYLCRGLPDDVHAAPDMTGEWGIDPDHESPVVVWGEGAGEGE